MCSFGWKATLAGALVLVAVVGPDRELAQSKVSPAEIDRPMAFDADHRAQHGSSGCQLAIQGLSSACRLNG